MTTSVEKAIAKVNPSNTVMASPPFNLRSEPTTLELPNRYKSILAHTFVVCREYPLVLINFGRFI